MAGVYYKLHFDDQGHPLHTYELEAIIRSLLVTTRPVTDLWIFSHGWNNNETRADTTYGNWMDIMQERIRQEITNPAYNPIFVGIYWPSMAWVDNSTSEPTFLPESPVATAMNGLDPGEFEMGMEDIDKSDEQGELESAQIEPQFEKGGLEAIQTYASGPLIQLEDKACFIEEYRAVMDPRSEHASYYDQDFAYLYDVLFQSTQPTSAQIEEFIRVLYCYKIDDPHNDVTENDNILNSPEEVLAYLDTELGSSATYEGFNPNNILFKFFHSFTFWTMKGRAAIVGQNGGAAFLLEVKKTILQYNRNVRLHLFGHSFGAKLLSAAVYGLAGVSNLMPPLVDNLILLLGAFSQFSFSNKIPLKPGGSGRYAPIIQRHLVANPIVAIYSRYDLANKNLYPFGMLPVLLARPARVYERGGPEDLLGAIGANGAQGLDAPYCHAMDMLPLEVPYDREHFTGVACLNVDGQHYINTSTDRLLVGAHGDIYHPEIFHLALAISRH